MADVSGRLFAANRAFRKMLGYTESELYRLTFLDITFEDDRRTNLRLFRGLVEGKRQQYQIEKRYRCKNGTLLGCVRTRHWSRAWRAQAHSGLTSSKTLPNASAWKTNSGCRFFDCARPKCACRRFSKQPQPDLLERPPGSVCLCQSRI